MPSPGSLDPETGDGVFPIGIVVALHLSSGGGGGYRNGFSVECWRLCLTEAHAVFPVTTDPLFFSRCALHPRTLFMASARPHSGSSCFELSPKF